MKSVPPPQELSAQVILRAQRGDRAAQRDVLIRYSGVFRGLVRRVLPGSSADVDELTQSALCQLLVALPKFDPNGTAKLTTWAFSVAHHFLIDVSRKRHLRVVPLEAAAEVVDAQPAPFEATWRAEIRSELEAAIETLPIDQRRVFVLVHIHEQPLEAVAEAEGVPVGTVKSRLFRARAKLAVELGPRLTLGADHGID